VIRRFAWLDLVVTAPLALPVVAPVLFSALAQLDGTFGSVTPLPVLEPAHWLFVHLTGVLGVVWALARLQLPDPRLARIDAIGRIVVAGLIVWAVAVGAPRVFGLFVATELAGAAAQLFAQSGAETEAARAASSAS